jgi:hypothetical protein
VAGGLEDGLGHHVGGFDLHVALAADEAVAPGVFEVLLQRGAFGAVDVEAGDAAVGLAGLEEKAPSLGQFREPSCGIVGHR